MNNKISPKDFFLNLGATVALLAGTIAIINLAFGILNKILPLPGEYYFSVNELAWPLSMVIIVTPVIYVIEWLINRDINVISEKADIWVRKWRIFLTLFLTGATVIGDAIAVLNVYLSGDLTNRFIFKAIAVFAVACVIFAYYILGIGKDRTQRYIAHRRTLAIVGIVLAVVAVVSAFVIIGSPSKQRSLKLDSDRVSDLTNIQYSILNYWQVNTALPASIDALQDTLAQNSLPRDPLSDEPYIYEVVKTSSVSPFTFKLCATFDLPSEASGRDKPRSGGLAMSPEGDNWEHPAGYYCFDRHIDTGLYRPFK